jgi:hypothetical protein
MASLFGGQTITPDVAGDLTRVITCKTPRWRTSPGSVRGFAPVPGGTLNPRDGQLAGMESRLPRPRPLPPRDLRLRHDRAPLRASRPPRSRAAAGRAHAGRPCACRSARGSRGSPRRWEPIRRPRSTRRSPSEIARRTVSHSIVRPSASSSSALRASNTVCFATPGETDRAMATIPPSPSS